MGGGSAAGGGSTAEFEEVNGIKLLAYSVEGLNPKDLRGLIDAGKSELQSGVVVIVGVTDDGKANLAVGIVGDALQSNNAVDLVRAGSEALGGKGGGGGRADLAQAGGPDGGKAAAALDAIRAALSSRVAT